jgi:isoquinoline 1-oxidoreductase subunit alpha
MDATSLTVSGQRHSVQVSPHTLLPRVLRDALRLTGTKFACGQAQCGACAAHVEGEATRSSTARISAVAGRSIITFPGLWHEAEHPVQQAWLADEVRQSAYSQAGMIMTTAALLAKNPAPTGSDIAAALGGHICRCGTYQRGRQAVHQAAAKHAASKTAAPVPAAAGGAR